MKKRDTPKSRAFWGQCFDLWFFCWIAYCACEFLMRMLFYRETMPHLRDYSILSWTQYPIFAVLYYVIFTRPAHRHAPIPSEKGFCPLRAVGSFFRRDWRQILLLLGCAVLYEVTRAIFPDGKNLFSALAVVLFPAASVIDVPALRTLIGVALSLVAMLLPHLLLLYRAQKRANTEKYEPAH